MYFKNWWHILCLAIVALGVADVIQNFVLPHIYGEDNSTVQITAMVFILLRTIRVFRLLEVALLHFVYISILTLQAPNHNNNILLLLSIVMF